jgi:hypothetical protein
MLLPAGSIVGHYVRAGTVGGGGQGRLTMDAHTVALEAGQQAQDGAGRQSARQICSRGAGNALVPQCLWTGLAGYLASPPTLLGLATGRVLGNAPVRFE